jgi:hypothetical protein
MFCFVRFDEPQKVQAAEIVSGENRPAVWSDSATVYTAISDESGSFFASLHVRNPKGVGSCRRHSEATVRRNGQGVDSVTVAF